MRLQVKKWGNSASVRIPASIMTAASLKIDQMVDVREHNGRVVIEPVHAPVYDLNVLIDHMSAETFPDDIDFGSPVGNEIW